MLLLAGVVIAQAILNWHFASQSFFYADDFVAFQDALSGRYSPDFLFAIHGGHLSPGRRAVTLFLQYHATLDYEFALGLLLVAHSISVVLVQRILRLLFGARWWTLAVAFAYGISIVISPALQWFSAGVLILPSTTFLPRGHPRISLLVANRPAGVARLVRGRGHRGAPVLHQGPAGPALCCS